MKCAMTAIAMKPMNVTMTAHRGVAVTAFWRAVRSVTTETKTATMAVRHRADPRAAAMGMCGPTWARRIYVMNNVMMATPTTTTAAGTTAHQHAVVMESPVMIFKRDKTVMKPAMTGTTSITMVVDATAPNRAVATVI